MTEAAPGAAPPAAPAPAAPAAPPANAGEARTLLDSLMAGKEFAEKLLAGDYSSNKQFSELQTMADAGPADKVALAMSSADLGFLPSSSDVQMRGFAEMLRANGFDERQTRETLEGKPASAEDVAIATRWKADNLGSKEFQARLLSGDPEAARLHLAANVILTSPRKIAG